MDLNIIRAGVFGFGLTAGQAVGAQEAVPIIEGGAQNAFYAQYSVVDDHPECSGSDKIAYRIPLRADGLDYVVFDPASMTAINSDGEFVDTSAECFITQRRGTETIEVEMPCKYLEEDDAAVFVDDLDISVALQGEATVCLSPMEVRVFDVSWMAFVTHGAGSDEPFETVRGSEDIHIRTNPPRLYQIDDDDRPRSVSYLSNQRFANDLVIDGDIHPLFRNLLGVSVISIEDECLAVGPIADDGKPIFVGLYADFAIVDDARQTCLGADCPEAVPLRYFNRPGQSGFGQSAFECGGFDVRPIIRALP